MRSRPSSHPIRSCSRIADAKLILDDLVEDRHASLVKSASGKLAEPELKELKERIDALPAALTNHSPFADDLQAEDNEHDDAGRVLYYACEGVLHDRDASPDAVAAAKNIRARFIPSLDELTAAFLKSSPRATPGRLDVALSRFG